jgi:Na+/proline symporter
MYVFTLLVMLFYMSIYLVAEITGVALIGQMVAKLPLWLTAAVVLAATLAYTVYGGLQASIYTDGIQSILILPCLAALLAVGFYALGGMQPTVTGLTERAPHLLQWGHMAGLKGALTLIIAILVANLFHQGYWQRVYAVRDLGVLRLAFFMAAVVSIPIVIAMGLFGLAAVGLGRAETPSVALFSVLLGVIPPWLMIVLVLLGLALVMSTTDTLLNGIASIVAVDLHRTLPHVPTSTLLRASRATTLGLAVPVWAIATQGYSVLYLFLNADLICAAAAFTVFFGLYSTRYTGRLAVCSTLAGLVTGGLLFPNPSFSRGSLLAAFVIAAVVPMIVSFACLPRQSSFDLASLRQRVRLIPQR